VKKRTKRLSEFFQSYHPYSHKIGEVQDVLVTEVSHDGKHYVGHNKFYEQVILSILTWGNLPACEAFWQNPEESVGHIWTGILCCLHSR
jgi:hypothetical protein